MAITLRIPVAAFTLLAVYTVATSFDLAPKIEDILEKAGNLAGAIRASAAKYFARSNKFQGHDSSLMSTPEDDETLERGKTDLFDVDYEQDVPTTNAPMSPTFAFTPSFIDDEELNAADVALPLSASPSMNSSADTVLDTSLPLCPPPSYACSATHEPHLWKTCSITVSTSLVVIGSNIADISLSTSASAPAGFTDVESVGDETVMPQSATVTPSPSWSLTPSASFFQTRPAFVPEERIVQASISVTMSAPIYWESSISKSASAPAQLDRFMETKQPEEEKKLNAAAQIFVPTSVKLANSKDVFSTLSAEAPVFEPRATLEVSAPAFIPSIGPLELSVISWPAPSATSVAGDLVETTGNMRATSPTTPATRLISQKTNPKADAFKPMKMAPPPPPMPTLNVAAPMFHPSANTASGSIQTATPWGYDVYRPLANSHTTILDNSGNQTFHQGRQTRHNQKFAAQLEEELKLRRIAAAVVRKRKAGHS